MTAQRPNFLFIITDQQRADHLRCSNPVLKTPHLDSLAHRGRRFENFFVNSGICQTNRATIMTDKQSLSTACGLTESPIALDSAVFPICSRLVVMKPRFWKSPLPEYDDEPAQFPTGC